VRGYPLGLIYREERVTFEERKITAWKGSLVRQDINLARAKALVEEFG
jgi:hypothetical protein